MGWIMCACKNPMADSDVVSLAYCSSMLDSIESSLHEGDASHAEALIAGTINRLLVIADKHALPVRQYLVGVAS